MRLNMYMLGSVHDILAIYWGTGHNITDISL